MGTTSGTDDDDFATMLAEGWPRRGAERTPGSNGSSDLDTVPGQAAPGHTPYTNGSAEPTEPSPYSVDPGPAPVLAPGADSVPFGEGGEGEGPAHRPRKSKRGARSRQGRKVRQRLWAVDPWSVFKISAMFYACMLVIVLVAGTVLWNVARSAGTIDEAESFVTRLAAYGECVPEEEVAKGTEFEEDDDCEEGTVLVDGFTINDGVVFKFAAVTGVIFAIAGSAANVLMAVLLNLINEVSGGMRYTIIREPSGAKPPGRIKRAARSLHAQVRR